MVICLERCADLHMAHLMPLPLTVSCFSKTQIGFIFLVPAHLGSPGKGQLNARVFAVEFTASWVVNFLDIWYWEENFWKYIMAGFHTDFMLID